MYPEMFLTKFHACITNLKIFKIICLAILRRMLKERDQLLRKERVFRDRGQELDTLNDHKLLSRYRFPFHIILRLVDLVKKNNEPKTYRSHAIPAHIQIIINFYFQSEIHSLLRTGLCTAS